MVASPLLTETVKAEPLQLTLSGHQSIVRAQHFASELGEVLSPTQVRTFLDCSAKWWFRYGLNLPEPKTSSLALGSALHRALEVNFREKIGSHEDLETCGVVALFRDAWLEQISSVEFREDENPKALCRIGETLVRKYMDEAAPTIQPAQVELDVSGKVGGVRVCGKVDLLDTDGKIVDIKTAARKPNSVSPSYAFQLATYRQITPGASGQARLDTLVKTKTIQLISHDYTVSEQDLQSIEVQYPLVQEGMRSGLYFPNRNSFTCSRRNCAFWRKCEAEYGGTVEL